MNTCVISPVATDAKAPGISIYSTDQIFTILDQLWKNIVYVMNNTAD